ncbi:hypothetical protein Slin15195_G067110 [Septoria linicola]|uniref:ubiquitinyl hydrolase 1 n=1 Tax=Septoria linicola TaxID=215465 RepID=A0A9Q9APM2_9PEZI|nr:hypothetical protein Slin14017_G099820 [Septoria linicola]USW53392.1 hypothetical protein Slin15195_G067110 [Septoria linicola]
MAVLISDRAVFERIVNHVFLPPQLPQKEDEADIDFQLLNVTSKALVDFASHLSQNSAARPAILRANAAITKALACHSRTTGAINETELLSCLEFLEVDGSLPLRVRAQNAGLLITRTAGDVRFEAFELAAQNKDVIGTNGRLIRSFPGTAVAIPTSTFESPQFRATLAQALTTMSVQQAPDMCPQIMKAGKPVDEERDTTHPGIVSELLVSGLLGAYGEPADAQTTTICKRTRDDVLWDDAELPFRRSPTWLLIRVSLQLITTRAMEGQAMTAYKAFMAAFVAQLLETACQLDVATDLQYAMSCKVARRLQKLGSTVPKGVQDALHQVQRRCNTMISNRWSNVQAAEPNPCHNLESIIHLRFEPDSKISLPELDDHLEQRGHRTVTSKSTAFEPAMEFDGSMSSAFPVLPVSGPEAYSIANLQRFEQWAQTHLSSYSKFTGGADVDEVSSKLSKTLQTYHKLASSVYDAHEKSGVIKHGQRRNPEGISSMMLMVLELWVALDKCALRVCPLLAKYDHFIPIDILQNLLLPFRDQMARLAEVEDYLVDRQKHVEFTAISSVFGEPRDKNCFAVQYFDNAEASDMQDMLEEYEKFGEECKQEKLAELRKAIQLYEEKKRKASELEHTYYTETQRAVQWPHKEYTTMTHDSECRKCSLERSADLMSIQVQEWPLPSNEHEAKAVVFELNIPTWYAEWRDSTLYLHREVLGLTNGGSIRPPNQYSLRKDPHLSHEYTADDAQRVVTWTKNKTHAATHRMRVRISKANEDNVCRQNASNYKYLDSETGFFIEDLLPTDIAARSCTFELHGPSVAMSRFLYRPSDVTARARPNDVIAAQSECHPAHMSAEEFKELGTLPLGHLIQWYNVLLQLAMPNVDFKKEETVLTFLQCISQAGPRDDDANVARATHAVLNHTDFANRILENLAKALTRVKENWESMNALVIFTSIASRLLTLSKVAGVSLRCLVFLRQVRNAAYHWLTTLKAKAQKSDNQTDYLHFLAKSVEVALVCASTFDVEASHLRNVLANSEDAAVLIYCSVTVNERSKPNKSTLLTLLDARLKRTLFVSYPIIAASHAGLDLAVKRIWASYEVGSQGWDSLGHGLEYWLHTSTASVDGEQVDVHYNLLTGDFRVAGVGLKAPPLAYQNHETYKTLFGRSAVEVMSSNQPGMTFSAKGSYDGYSVHLGMTARGLSQHRDLLVQACNDSETFELVPKRLIQRHFPDHFIDDYVHWYHAHSGTVHFRPRETLWDSSGDTVRILVKDPRTFTWQLQQGVQGRFRCVLDLKNLSTSAIATVLSPLVEASKIHITLLPSGRALDVDIPTIGLGFTLKSGEKFLYSKEFPGMAVDDDQSSGVLIGFRNKLLLCKPAAAVNRRLLIPEGAVHYRRTDHHVEVSVDRDTVVKIHDLEIDHRLGRLVDKGSLQSKLFLAYLHALTSFALPDPLTRKTGTEQALSLLSSAASFSFEELTQPNVTLLIKIAHLTPARCFYPHDAETMQKVTWDPKLSFMAQHGQFFKSAAAIFAQARRSKMFYPTSDVLIPSLDHVVEKLLDRDLVRTASFRVAEYGAEYHSRGRDVAHTKGRDQIRDRGRASKAWRVSTMLSAQNDDVYWQLPKRGSLWQKLQNLPTVFGAENPLEKGLLRYDGALLQKPEEDSIAPYLLSLYHTLTEKQANVNPYALQTWLATLTFSKNADVRFVQIIASFYSADTIRGIVPPQADTFSPNLGVDADLSTLLEIVDEAKVTFDESPDAKAPPKKIKPRFGPPVLETTTATELRRREDYARRSEGAVKAFAQAIFDQWAKSPGQTPVEPAIASEAKCSAYIDVGAAMEAVITAVETWINNRALKEFCDHLENALNDLPVAQLVLPDWQRNRSEGLPSARGHVTLKDVFSGDVPQNVDGSSLPILSLQANLTRTSAINSKPHHTLETIIDTFVSDDAGPYEKQYVRNLRESLVSLQARDQRTWVPVVLPTNGQLVSHLNACVDHVKLVYSRLRTAAQDQLGFLSGNRQGLQWPRISPVLFLEQLGRERWRDLNDKPKWQEAILEYGVAITAVQRAERMLNALLSHNDDDLRRELENAGHRNWSPRAHPETLLLEIESSIMVRDVQESIAQEMRKETGGNEVLQLNMGEGKSSVIVPMVATALANGSQLVRVIVGKAQSKQMAQMLISKLGGLLNRRVYYLPYSRALKLRKTSAEAVFEHCQECMRMGGVLLVQPEHILSFALTGPESYISSGNEDAGEVFLRTQDFFDRKSRDIIDESDENLSVRFELVYTMGLRRQAEYAPNRWNIIHQIMDLVKTHATDMADEQPGALEFIKSAPGGFPRLRVLEQAAADQLMERIADDICANGLHELPASSDALVRDALQKYICKLDLNRSEIEAVESSPFWCKDYKMPLLLVRGLLASGILDFVLRMKRWRVQYGLTTRYPATRLAVPYRAKDFPSLRSEFSHPDVVILVTTLSYYYGGLEDQDIFTMLGQLMTADSAEQEYRSWLKDTGMPEEFRSLDGINLRDEATCKTRIFPYLKHAKAAVDYFLAHIVFPKEMKEYPSKLSASGCDLGKKKFLPTKGFSGTNDTRIVLPLDVNQLDLPEQKHTNALVLSYLLQPENSLKTMSSTQETGRSDAEQLLDMVMQLQPPVDVVLDPGAQILELDNLAVAKAWLARCDASKKAAVYCNDNDELCVVDRTGRCELLQTSSYAARMDKCVIYLDEAHTRGIDLKLPPKYRAACTLGSGLAKDRLVQACMRMRKLGKGQTIVFIASQEISTQIRRVSKMRTDQTIGVADVLRWVISETHNEMRHSMSLWAAQNDRFTRQQELWTSNTENGRRVLTKVSAQKFLEEESRDMEFRYAPKLDAETPLAKLAKDTRLKSVTAKARSQQIIDRCELFGMLEFSSRKLTEEQERELSPENDVAAERVVQKALYAKPAIHYMWSGWESFVRNGMLNTGTKGSPIPAFEVLRKTSAGQQFDVSQLKPQNLLASADFAKTIVEPAKGSLSDSFLRSVQWVLTGRKTRTQSHVDYVIVISPFEAQELMGEIMASSYVALHLYRARTNTAYDPLDDLSFYTVSSRQLRLDIREDFIIQLNLLAGQLYCSSYDQYLATARYLGLAAGSIQPGWKITADGFVKENENGEPGRPDSLVKANPVQFLKLLLGKIRRNGEDISRTHLGKLLNNKTLRASDFV